MERERTRDHFARTFLGDRSLALLSSRGVFPFCFFIKSAMKLVVELPMTVDLSPIAAARTDADTY